MIGLVLAGGKSRRFGTDKALYCFADQTVNNAQLAVDKLTTLCERVLISANSYNVTALKKQFANNHNVQVIMDQPPFEQHGPLSGIYAAACQFKHPQDYLLLAVDYPLISVGVLQTLANHGNCYATTPNAAHYTLAHFTTDRTTLRDFLLLDDYRLSCFIRETENCEPVAFSNAELFINYNTPEAKPNAD